MRFTTMEKNLSQLIEPELRDVTPGVQIRAFQAGKIVCDIALGQTYAYYDLASLTKIISAQFTVQKFIKQSSRKILLNCNLLKHGTTTLKFN